MRCLVLQNIFMAHDIMDDFHDIYRLQHAVFLDLIQIFDFFIARRYDIRGMPIGNSRRFSHMRKRLRRFFHIDFSVYTSAVRIGITDDARVRAEHKVFGRGAEVLRLSQLSENEQNDHITVFNYFRH